MWSVAAGVGRHGFICSFAFRTATNGATTMPDERTRRRTTSHHPGLFEMLSIECARSAGVVVEPTRLNCACCSLLNTCVHNTRPSAQQRSSDLEMLALSTLRLNDRRPIYCERLGLEIQLWAVIGSKSRDAGPKVDLQQVAIVIGACLLLWCLGDVARPTAIRAIGTQDVYHNGGTTNRLLLIEDRWLFGGYAYQPDSTDAIFAGGFPLQINLLGPRVSLAGGALVATASMPRLGTNANWIARAQVSLTKRVALEIVHISNGGINDIANPAIDSIGLSVRLK